MEEKKAPNWQAVRDLFAQLIEPANWQSGDLIVKPDEMLEHFQNAYPGVDIWLEDMKLALHDLNIPFERNEHNNEFYYLARWK